VLGEAGEIGRREKRGAEGVSKPSPRKCHTIMVVVGGLTRISGGKMTEPMLCLQGRSRDIFGHLGMVSDLSLVP